MPALAGVDRAAETAEAAEVEAEAAMLRSRPQPLKPMR
jgi:hypothetical protein